MGLSGTICHRDLQELNHSQALRPIIVLSFTCMPSTSSAWGHERGELGLDGLDLPGGSPVAIGVNSGPSPAASCSSISATAPSSPSRRSPTHTASSTAGCRRAARSWPRTGRCNTQTTGSKVLRRGVPAALRGAGMNGAASSRSASPTAQRPL